MSIEEDEIEEKGKEAQVGFEKFMDAINVPYLGISNDRETFSAVLNATLNSKRPDYLLLLGKAGVLPVEVKYRREDLKGYENYNLGRDEVERYLNFSEAFGVDVWYAISNIQMKYAIWYWVSVNDIDEKGFEIRTNRDTGKEFYVAPKKELIKVSANDEIPLAKVVHKLTMPHITSHTAAKE